MDVGRRSDYLYRHRFATTKQKQTTSHPPLLFSVCLSLSSLHLWCVSLHPAASSVRSQKPPPERGLMRANDRSACCRFSLSLTGPHFAHAAFHLCVLSASPLFFFFFISPHSIHHLLALSCTLHPFQRSNGVAFPHFPPIYTCRRRVWPVIILPSPPLLL